MTNGTRAAATSAVHQALSVAPAVAAPVVNGWKRPQPSTASDTVCPLSLHLLAFEGRVVTRGIALRAECSRGWAGGCSGCYAEGGERWPGCCCADPHAERVPEAPCEEGGEQQL